MTSPRDPGRTAITLALMSPQPVRPVVMQGHRRWLNPVVLRTGPGRK